MKALATSKSTGRVTLDRRVNLDQTGRIGGVAFKYAAMQKLGSLPRGKGAVIVHNDTQRELVATEEVDDMRGGLMETSLSANAATGRSWPSLSGASRCCGRRCRNGPRRKVGSSPRPNRLSSASVTRNPAVATRRGFYSLIPRTGKPKPVCRSHNMVRNDQCSYPLGIGDDY